MRIVFDVESDPARCLGEFVRDDEDTIVYVDSYGDTGRAPTDCCHVVNVHLPDFGVERVVVQTEQPLEELTATSDPIPGRPGWRRDSSGREWYSAAWL